MSEIQKLKYKHDRALQQRRNKHDCALQKHDFAPLKTQQNVKSWKGDYDRAPLKHDRAPLKHDRASCAEKIVVTTSLNSLVYGL